MEAAVQPEGAGAVIRAGCRRRASGTVAACRSRTKGAEISPNNKSGLHPVGRTHLSPRRRCEIRFGRQCPGDADALFLAAGKFGRKAIAELGRIKLDQVQKLIDPYFSAGPLRLPPFHSGVQHQRRRVRWRGGSGLAIQACPLSESAFDAWLSFERRGGKTLGSSRTQARARSKAKPVNPDPAPDGEDKKRQAGEPASDGARVRVTHPRRLPPLDIARSASPKTSIGFVCSELSHPLVICRMFAYNMLKDLFGEEHA